VVDTSDVNPRGASASEWRGSSAAVGASGDRTGGGGVGGAGGGLPSLATYSVPHDTQMSGTQPPAEGTARDVEHTGQVAVRVPSAPETICANRCAPCAAGGAGGRNGPPAKRPDTGAEPSRGVAGGCGGCESGGVTR
jgi:hypothetical protein